MTDNLTLSVVICAYTMNRWHDIGDAIQSLRRQTRRPDEIILVIDHNDAMRAQAEMTFPDVQVIANREPQGLSGGRNTGIAAATSTLIAFLDDDAEAEPDWVAHVISHFADPSVVGVSSLVQPHWIGTRPGWFPHEFLWTVGCSFRGQPTQVAEIRNVIGAGMVIRRSVFSVVGGFAATLGRTGGTLVSCEETELCIRARAAIPRARFLMAPDAVIHHKIPAARLTWNYFLRRCVAEGHSKAVVAKLADKRGALGTERDYVLRTLTSGFLLGVSDTVRHLRWQGMGRAAAIALGLSATTYGYVAEKLTRA